MVWDKRLWRLAWIIFIVMWLPLGVLIYLGVKGVEEPPVEALFAFFGLCIVFTVLLIGSFFVGTFEKEKIKKNGIAAKATIVSLSDTGLFVNNQPRLKITLDVQPPYDARFTTTVEYIVPYSFLPMLQPGVTVPVYYIEGTREVALADL